jgi:hypothetical protein
VSNIDPPPPTALFPSLQRATLSPEALRLRDQLQREREHQQRLQRELADLKASMGYGDVSGGVSPHNGPHGPTYARRESPLYTSDRSGSPKRESPKRDNSSRPGSATAQCA